MNTNSKPTIPDHWDPSALINANSQPNQEFARWKAHAAENPADWNGDEFTLDDFEDYIDKLMAVYQDL